MTSTAISLCYPQKKRIFQNLELERMEKGENRGILTIWIIGLFFLLSLSLIYCFEVNKLSTLGGDLDYQKKKMEELEDEREKLEREISQKRSVDNLLQIKKELSFVKPEKIDFVELERGN